MTWCAVMYLFAGLSHFIWDHDRTLRLDRQAKLLVLILCLTCWPIVTVFRWLNRQPHDPWE